MNIYALISLLASVLCIFLGNFIYYQNPKNQLNRIIALLCLLVAFLAFVEFEYRQTDDIETAYFWLKLSTFWPFVPSLLLHIALIFTRNSKILQNKLNYLFMYLPAFIFTILGLTTNLLIDGAQMEYWGWTYIIPQNPALFLIMAFWTIFMGILAALIIFIHYLNRRNEFMERKQAKYIFLGLYTPLIISLITDLISPFINLKVPELTMTMSSVGLAFISYGTWKYEFPVLTPSIATDKIIDNMTNFLILMDQKNKIVSVNPAASKLLGYNESELIGMPIKLIYGNKHDLPVVPDKKLINELKMGLRDSFETMLERKDGIVVPVLMSMSSIQNKETRGVLGIVFIGSDLTDYKRMENQIKASLKEKEILLREIHHRVKNNLQVISSLLNLQASSIEDQERVDFFKEIQNRVKSMAMVHERLYQTDESAKIEFRDYIENLLSGLYASYGVDINHIRLKMNIEKIFIDIDIAIPCGLIVNELVTNSMKHAFPDGREGEIGIDLSSDGKEYTLVVVDNGVGFPNDLDFRNTDTLGMRIVNSLVYQLDGTINLGRENGTKFVIKFGLIETDP